MSTTVGVLVLCVFLSWFVAPVLFWYVSECPDSWFGRFIDGIWPRIRSGVVYPFERGSGDE